METILTCGEWGKRLGKIVISIEQLTARPGWDKMQFSVQFRCSKFHTIF